MNEDFVTYEIAKKLKEKGFNEPCYGYYHLNGGDDSFELCGNDSFDFLNSLNCFRIAAPTISQVLKWLRDKKKIFVAINIGYCYESYEKPFPTNPKMEPILKGYYYGIWELDNLNDKNASSEYFEAPEFAILAGIEYVIDNLI